MKARTSFELLLATALAVAMVVAGCGGGSVVSNGPPPVILNAWLEGAGTAPDYSALPGEEVRVLAEAPDGSTNVQATIEGLPGEPVPDGGTIILLEGPWTSPATHGRSFRVPVDATSDSTYDIQVTADTPSGPLESDVMTLTVGAETPVPCLAVPYWFGGHDGYTRVITEPAGATVTVLAKVTVPGGWSLTSVRATIEGSPEGSPVPPEGSVIGLAAGTWPDPDDLATHGGTFTVPSGAASGTTYDIRVVANLVGPEGPCQGTSNPMLDLTVQ